MPMQQKNARTARPQTLGERMAARRQREAHAAVHEQEEEEEEEEADQSMTLLPEGLHNALSEMSKAFAQTPAAKSPEALPGIKRIEMLDFSFFRREKNEALARQHTN